MNKHILLSLLILSTSAWATSVDKLKAELQKKGMNGNPVFVGDFLEVNKDVTEAHIYKITPCSQKECSFDFSSNVKVAGKNELFTCSLPPEARISYAVNGKAYLIADSHCAFRMEMKDVDTLEVVEIGCAQAKVGDCDKNHLVGTFYKLGRPSFDCGILTPYLELTPARRAICNNHELSDLDKETDDLYVDVESKDTLHKLDNSFKRDREACKEDVKCLTSLYQTWRSTLQKLKTADKK